MTDFRRWDQLLLTEVVGAAAMFALALVDTTYFGAIVVALIIGVFALAMMIGLRRRD